MHIYAHPLPSQSTTCDAITTYTHKVVLSTSAWLGHSLVYRYGVAVEPAKKA